MQQSRRQQIARTSWIINAVDGMQLYGAVNSKSMWSKNRGGGWEIARAARIWAVQNNYPG